MAQGPGLWTKSTNGGYHEPIAHWMEYGLDGAYEEEWAMLDGYHAHGAHLAALRSAQPGMGMCWLGILGNTFAFAAIKKGGAVVAWGGLSPAATALPRLNSSRATSWRL